MKEKAMKIPKQGGKAEFKKLSVKHTNEGQSRAAAWAVTLVAQTLRAWINAKHPRCMAWNTLFAQINCGRSR